MGVICKQVNQRKIPQLKEIRCKTSGLRKICPAEEALRDVSRRNGASILVSRGLTINTHFLFVFDSAGRKTLEATKSYVCTIAVGPGKGSVNKCSPTRHLRDNSEVKKLTVLQYIGGGRHTTYTHTHGKKWIHR